MTLIRGSKRSHRYSEHLSVELWKHSLRRQRQLHKQHCLSLIRCGECSCHIGDVLWPELIHTLLRPTSNNHKGSSMRLGLCHRSRRVRELLLVELRQQSLNRSCNSSE
eukprot:gnl/TRDRNA2_/TRDRNA2_174764_c10_seq1.p1 gnl/TRDRNA2_/TRDRNA2_174764_c10~~gnl/TRDRNA2_/TRDRNA2_174764_c10_seq1.p1  ORF type:complete len:108 (+),score=8.99 gnl/TRDRNA2_/TRDRNA2_174764_c10_seq1:348-671(+)